VTSKTLDVRAQELQIIKRVANGARNAEEIFRGTGSSMTLETVKLRLEDLMKKLGVTEVGEIPQKANALGLLPD
jgi:ATP/maltotriose-dependent transcriptional regulator MalT